MRISHVDGKDLTLLERRLSRSGGYPFLPEDGRKGMLIQSVPDEEPLGLAIYDIAGDKLTVAALRARAFDQEVGRALAQGLKGIAAEKSVRSIWLIAEEEAKARGFLRDCGFQLMGFFRADPADPRAPKMGYWKLS